MCNNLNVECKDNPLFLCHDFKFKRLNILIMGLIRGAIGAAGGIFGGISASKALRQMKRNVEAQRKSNQDWYDQRYNEDATQRADAQRLLTMTEESIRKRNQQAAGSAAVMGGTDESVAAAKEANGKALSDTMSNINASAEARKDQIEQTYRQKDDEYVNQLNQIEQGKAQAISQAVQGVASVASKLPV